MKRYKKCFAALAIMCLMVIIGSVQTHAAPGLPVSKKKMVRQMSRHSIRVRTGERTQRFAFSPSEVKKVKIKKKQYNKAAKTQTVKGVVYIDRTVAVVKANVTMKYRRIGPFWKLRSVKFSKARISKIKLIGTWEGRYTANQGRTGVTITVKETTVDGYLTAGVFNFYAIPSNPSVPTGAYTLRGSFDNKTGEVVFRGDEWISHPTNYHFITIFSQVDLAKKKITSGSNSYSMTLKKVR